MPAVVAALGLTMSRDGRRFGPCPGCGGGTDGRIVRLNRGTSPAWACLVEGCGAAGDAAHLIGWVVLGRKPSGAEDWQRVSDEAEALGLVAPLDAGGPPPSLRGPVGRPSASVAAGAGVGAPVATGARGGPPGERDDVPRRWPARDELAALARACGPVAGDAEAVTWCRSRGLDPARLDALGLARVLEAEVPAEVEALTWPRLGERRAWWSGWRLVLGVVGPDGRVIGTRARWIGAGAPPVAAKEIGGFNVPAGPACYADKVGRWLLEAGAAARPGAEVPDTAWRWSGVVVIAEGGPDWLTLASSHKRDRRAATAAVLGVWSGAWAAELAERLRSARVVRLALDPDDGGERLAAKALETLPASVRVEVDRG